MTRARHGSYLFQRPGSKNFWIKLRSGGQRIEKSLGTGDKLQAEHIAAKLIGEHKAALLAARPRFETMWKAQYMPGLHTGPDGTRIFATERELHRLDAEGHTIRTEPNGGLAHHLVGDRVTLRSLIDAYRTVDFGDSVGRPKLAKKTSDDAIIETYIKHANLTGRIEQEARDVWALFKTLTDNKALKECDRDDGRKLVEYFDQQENRSATIQKKVTWLNAACNLAIKEGRLKFNPFSGIVPKREDKLRRQPLNEADMKNVKRNLDKLAAADQLLLRVLSSTGMRLSEAFEIESELKERGIRFVIVGKKTEQSERRVPLPATVIPHLPKSIRGALFKGSIPAASKRLNRFLNDCGIADPRKVAHSLRHRAQDRLRAAGCPQDIREQLLGHEQKTVGEGYGVGSPVPLLKKWIDKIGF